MIEVGFTGSRLGMSSHQYPRVFSVMHSLHTFIYRTHHGCCVGGDSEFHQICWDLPIPAPIKGHPPINPRYHNRGLKGFQSLAEPNEYLPRDRAIVKESRLLVAAPNTFQPVKRSGTWYTVNYAIKKKVPVVLIRPDGSMEYKDKKKGRSLNDFIKEATHA